MFYIGIAVQLKYLESFSLSTYSESCFLVEDIVGKLKLVT